MGRYNNNINYRIVVYLTETDKVLFDGPVYLKIFTGQLVVFKRRKTHILVVWI